MQDNISPVNAFFRNKWVRLILMVDAAALVGLFVMIIMNAMKTSVLYFNVTPIDATISVNGDTNYENGSYRVMPGKYEIAISHEGMETKTFEIELEGDAIANVVTFLVGDGSYEGSFGGKEFGFYELKDNYDSYMKLKEIVSGKDNAVTDEDVKAAAFVKRMEEDIALYTSGVLPIRYAEYNSGEDGCGIKKRITIRNGHNSGECAKTLCLQALMLYTDEKELVDSLILDNGLELENYEIIYKIY